MILPAKAVLKFHIFMIYLLIVNNSSKKIFHWLSDQWRATMNYLKHTVEISLTVCAQLSCLYSSHSDVDPYEIHFVIASLFSAVYRLHLPLHFFFCSTSLHPPPMTSISLNINSQQTCHLFLNGDSSVHSSHSLVYSKTLPPYLSSLFLLKTCIRSLGCSGETYQTTSL